MNDSEQTMHFVTGMSLIGPRHPKKRTRQLLVGSDKRSFPFLRDFEF